jgi:hypothetical protein
MSEDKDNSPKQDNTGKDWVIPRGVNVDVTHVSPQKLAEINKKKNLTFDIDGDSISKEGKVRVDINEVVVKASPNSKTGK